MRWGKASIPTLPDVVDRCCSAGMAMEFSGPIDGRFTDVSDVDMELFW